MKNMYDVWVMDLDHMDLNREDTAEHYMIAAKSMSAAIAKVEKAYEDPEKGPERHLVVWAETKFNGEELPRDMYEIWSDECLRGEDMADVMEASHQFLFEALKEKRARRGAEIMADMDMTVQAAADKVAKAAATYENPLRYPEQDHKRTQKLSDNPYQE